MSKGRLMIAALAAWVAAPGVVSAQHGGHGVAGKDLVQVAVEAGQFGTLLRAVQAAGLVEVLRGEGPFTVFAPTDAAFAKLPAGTVESLLRNTEQLKAVLTYHVVPGRVMARDIVSNGQLRTTTANGAQLTARARDGEVRVGNATVVAADVGASNGVIHVIDEVLLPPAAGAQ